MRDLEELQLLILTHWPGPVEPGLPIVTVGEGPMSADQQVVMREQIVWRREEGQALGSSQKPRDVEADSNGRESGATDQNRPRARSLWGNTSRQVVHQPVVIVSMN